MNEKGRYPPGFSSSDLFFDCPHCSKSMAIDRRGAGLIVRCPDCGARMQVPVPTHEHLFDEASAQPGKTTTADYTRAADRATDPATPDLTVQRLKIGLAELHERKDYLENLRLDHLRRFENIADQIALIQAALDRMVDILQDIAAEPGAGDLDKTSR